MGLQSMGVECPKVRASDKHCYIVRVLRAQGHAPMASRFLSPPSRYVVTKRVALSFCLFLISSLWGRWGSLGR